MLVALVDYFRCFLSNIVAEQGTCLTLFLQVLSVIQCDTSRPRKKLVELNREGDTNSNGCECKLWDMAGTTWTLLSCCDAQHAADSRGHFRHGWFLSLSELSTRLADIAFATARSCFCLSVRILRRDIDIKLHDRPNVYVLLLGILCGSKRPP